MIYFLKVISVILIFATVVCWQATPSRGETKRPKIRVPLRIRIARCASEPVRTRQWVEKHLAAARRVFVPVGIDLEPTIDEFAPTKCELSTRKDRRAAAVHVDNNQLTVLVVRRVSDLDVPTYNLMGVHWRYFGSDKSQHGRHWIFLTARAEPPVLAHEICHFFGLKHDLAGGNLMTPGPSDPIYRAEGPKPAPFEPRLNKQQTRELRLAVEKNRSL